MKIHEMDAVSAYPTGLYREAVILRGKDQAVKLHAIKASKDEWHTTTPDMPGISVESRRSLISRIATIIADGECEAILFRPSVELFLDGLNNAWVYDDYMAPTTYLPYFITE